MEAKHAKLQLSPTRMESLLPHRTVWTLVANSWIIWMGSSIFPMEDGYVLSVRTITSAGELSVTDAIKWRLSRTSMESQSISWRKAIQCPVPWRILLKKTTAAARKAKEKNTLLKCPSNCRLLHLRQVNRLWTRRTFLWTAT